MSFKQYSEFQSPLNVFLGAGASNSNNLITSSCTRAMCFIISTIFYPNLMMEIVKRVLVSVSSLDLKSWIRQVLPFSLRSGDQLWTACASYDGSAWIKTLFTAMSYSLSVCQFGILLLVFRVSYLALEVQILTLSLYITQT